MLRRNVRNVMMAALGLLAGPAGEVVALAAKSKAKAGGPPALQATTSFWPILCTAVALLGICVVAFKNARRSHLD